MRMSKSNAGRSSESGLSWYSLDTNDYSTAVPWPDPRKSIGFINFLEVCTEVSYQKLISHNQMILQFKNCLKKLLYHS